MRGRKVHITPLGWLVFWAIIVVIFIGSVVLTFVLDDDTEYWMIGQPVALILIGILFGGAESDD